MRPTGLAGAAALIAALVLSACSGATTAHYREYVDGLRAEGRLRTDTAPADAPFTNEDLARNFVEIALYSEFDEFGRAAPGTEVALSRWEGPIRYSLVGAGVRQADRREVAALMRRIAGLTGLQVVQDDENPNFGIFILSERERGDFARAFAVEYGPEAAALPIAWAQDIQSDCVAQYFYNAGEMSPIISAEVMIKAEIDGIYRLSCLHEEIVQSLGLTNDSDAVRPSIFNDDEEFALLTEHDEYLLRILHHPRLRVGMERSEVEAVVAAVVDDIRPEGARYFRADRAPADAPFSNADLARNFARIALFREYDRRNGVLKDERAAIPVTRWSQPIRYFIDGDDVRPEDELAYAALAARLTALTGVRIEADADDPNVNILILGPEGRATFVASLRENGSAERLPLIVRWAENPNYSCIGQAGVDDETGGNISSAIIVIKAELEGIFRQSCIEEELAQVMGLLNDDDRVRPSVFNDDEEFALLTTHDEYLLKALYDPAIRPGMSAADVAAVLPAVIERIRPGGSATRVALSSSLRSN